MILAAQTWRQTGADVILVGGVVTALLVIWARVFSGPIGRWFDARATAVAKATIEPLADAVAEMRNDNVEMRTTNTAQHVEIRTTNTAQHVEVRVELHSLRADVNKLTDRLDGHIDAADRWRSEHKGDGR